MTTRRNALAARRGGREIAGGKPTGGVRLVGMNDDPAAVAQSVVRELFGTPWWAVLSGSVLTDARTDGSDLDIVVVVDPGPGVPYRRSLRWCGWPVDLFVHDSAGLEHYLSKDLARRQPSLHRMCATGVLLTEPHPHAVQVKVACQEVLSAGPPPLPGHEMAALRYGLTDLLDDLTHSVEPGETAVIAAVCWLRTAELALHLGQHWLGSGKWLLRELCDCDPVFADRWRAASGDPSAVAALACHVLHRAGGALFGGYHAAGERPPPAAAPP